MPGPCTKRPSSLTPSCSAWASSRPVYTRQNAREPAAASSPMNENCAKRGPREPVVPGERVQAVGEVGDAVDGQVVVRRRRAERPRQQAHRHPALGHRLDLLDPGLERVGDDGVPRREPRRHHQLGPVAGRGLLGGGPRPRRPGRPRQPAWPSGPSRCAPRITCRAPSGPAAPAWPSAPGLVRPRITCRALSGPVEPRSASIAGAAPRPARCAGWSLVELPRCVQAACRGAPAGHLSSSFRCIQAACCGARLVSDHSRSISHFTASSRASRASSSGSGHASSMPVPVGVEEVDGVEDGVVGHPEHLDAVGLEPGPEREQGLAVPSP